MQRNINGGNALQPCQAGLTLMFATELDTVQPRELAAWKALAQVLPWRQLPGYLTAEVPLQGYSRAFMIKIEPGCAVHRHRDRIPTPTDHIVIATNGQCLNWWQDERGEHSEHMAYGKRYRVERDGIHWATNDGETDRIHLLIEY